MEETDVEQNANAFMETLERHKSGSPTNQRGLRDFRDYKWVTIFDSRVSLDFRDITDFRCVLQIF